MRVYLAAHYDSRRLTPRRARKNDPLDQCYDITEKEFQEFFKFCIDIDARFLPGF